MMSCNLLVFILGAGGFITLCDFLSFKNLLYYLTCRPKGGIGFRIFPPKLLRGHYDLHLIEIKFTGRIFTSSLKYPNWRLVTSFKGGRGVLRGFCVGLDISEILYFSSSSLKVRQDPRLHSGRSLLKHRGTRAETFSFGPSCRTIRIWLKLPGSRWSKHP